MKIVVQIGPDETELILNELDESDFIVDQETYCYFRDEIFINGILNFIENKAPGKVLNTEVNDGAERAERWFHNQELINKYYPQFNKKRKRFYLYKDGIYSYDFLGFMNVTNEIQLLKYDMQDIVNILNNAPETLFGMLKAKVRKNIFA